MVYQLFNLIFSWFALVSAFFGLVRSRTVADYSLTQANYYIAFVILSDALEGFGLGKGIHVVNVILNYFYLGGCLFFESFLATRTNYRLCRSSGHVFLAVAGKPTPRFKVALHCFVLGLRSDNNIHDGEFLIFLVHCLDTEIVDLPSSSRRSS